MTKKRNRNGKRKKHTMITIIIFAMLLTSTVGMFYLGKNSLKNEKNSKEEGIVRRPNEENQTEKEPPKPKIVKKERNYIVKESEKVDLSYFDDAVFIGNSRTQGLMLYGGITNAKFYADKGLVISKVFDKPITIMGEQNKDTVVNALIRNPFKKYYIMLGTNELGWAYENIFIEKYQELIDKIKEINSEAIIYIQSILPVSKAKSEKDKVYNNPNIEHYNDLLKDLVKKNKVYYVDVAQQFKDEEGNLDADASSDGIHLKAAFCKEWTEYLKSHTIKLEDEENEKIQNTDNIKSIDDKLK